MRRADSDSVQSAQLTEVSAEELARPRAAGAGALLVEGSSAAAELHAVEQPAAPHAPTLGAFDGAACKYR